MKTRIEELQSVRGEIVLVCRRLTLYSYDFLNEFVYDTRCWDGSGGDPPIHQHPHDLSEYGWNVFFLNVLNEKKSNEENKTLYNRELGNRADVCVSTPSQLSEANEIVSWCIFFVVLPSFFIDENYYNFN